MMELISPKESTILTFLAGYAGGPDAEADQDVKEMLDGLTTPVAKDIGLYLVGRKPRGRLKEDVAAMADAFKESVRRIQQKAR